MLLQIVAYLHAYDFFRKSHIPRCIQKANHVHFVWNPPSCLRIRASLCRALGSWQSNDTTRTFCQILSGAKRGTILIDENRNCFTVLNAATGTTASARSDATGIRFRTVCFWQWSGPSGRARRVSGFGSSPSSFGFLKQFRVSGSGVLNSRSFDMCTLFVQRAHRSPMVQHSTHQRLFCKIKIHEGASNVLKRNEPYLSIVVTIRTHHD